MAAPIGTSSTACHPSADAAIAAIRSGASRAASSAQAFARAKRVSATTPPGLASTRFSGTSIAPAPKPTAHAPASVTGSVPPTMTATAPATTRPVARIPVFRRPRRRSIASAVVPAAITPIASSDAWSAAAAAEMCSSSRRYGVSAPIAYRRNPTTHR